jgi:hypothetical protein
MKRKERTDRNWARVIALLTLLLTVVELPSWGQQTLRVTRWRSENHLVGASPAPRELRPLAEVLRSSRPDLRLEALLSSLPRPERLAPGSQHPFPGREPFGLAAQADRLIGDLHGPAASPRGLLRVAWSALRALDAPGNALCRLTGADRASFNPLKKRISLTWYVDFP